MNAYSLLIDLVLILIIGFAVYFSARKGFVRTVVEAVGLLAAVIITLTICTPLANATYDKIIEPPLLEATAEKVNASFEGQLDKVPDFNVNSEQFTQLKSQISSSINDFIKDLPKVVQNFIEQSGLETNKLFENTDTEINGEETIGNTAQNLVRDISQTKIKPIAVELISAFYSLVVLTVLLIAVKILAVSLNKVFSFSLAGKLNTFFGGVCGLIKGLAIAFLLCAVIYTVISFTENGSWIFTLQNIEKTIIFKTLIGLIKI